MSWLELQQFFLMGGYGIYVWSAYAIAVVVLCINLIVPVIDHTKTLKEIKNRRAARKT